VPKLPKTDHLHNQGKPAFPKWKELKNLRMRHDYFCAKIIKNAELENISAQHIIFCGSEIFSADRLNVSAQT